MKTAKPATRTTLQRAPDRGYHDAETIHRILDATPLCHVGFEANGQTVVTPTIHWRDDNYIYWHGSRISRTLLASEQTNVCVTVTLLDGMVLARSAFHHSANYRSVMVFGTPTLVDDKTSKTAALKALVEKLTPGRWDTLRPMSEKELAATSVLSLPLDEASAKVRTGGPNDLAEDMAYPVWAGVIPIQTLAGEPEPCPNNLSSLTEPDNLRGLKVS